MSTVNKNDFVEIKFTGYVQGTIFDSNIAEDLKKISPKDEPKPTIVVVGQSMVVPGLDKSLIGKEVGKEYRVTLSPEDGFGPRKKDLVKMIPLKIFTEQKIQPYTGLMLTLDNALVKIISVSGARVLVDFNNPLSGKEIAYRFTITRIVTEDKEKVASVLESLLRFVPEFDISDKVTLKGPKPLEMFVNVLKDKFKELIGKDLVFELKEDKKEDKKEESAHEHHHDHSHQGHDHSHEGHNHDHEGHNHSHHDHKH